MQTLGKYFKKNEILCCFIIEYNLFILTFYFDRFAQHISLSEESNVIKGSPLYMAPEILLNHSYNPSADLWSIGVILYECLYGFAPYSSKTTEELLSKIKSKKKIVIPSDTKISPICRDLMNRLLVHDPKRRLNFLEFFSHDFVLDSPVDEVIKVL